MKDSKQEGRVAPTPGADAATPFFARFLEDQHGGAGAAQAETGFLTLKYPSDRDEGDVTLPPPRQVRGGQDRAFAHDAQVPLRPRRD